jgi:hypothetical protein
MQTVAEPDVIQRGDYGELLAMRHFACTPLTGKFVVVVYRETSAAEGFVITAYLTRRPSRRREILWQKQT